MKNPAIVKKWEQEALAQGCRGALQLALRKLATWDITDEEGIVIADDIVPPALQKSLCHHLDVLASEPGKQDFHPGSDGMVQNLIHPSLYPFIEGISALRPSHLPHAADGVPGEFQEWDRFSRCVVEHEETSRYQWLPAEVDVDADGKAKFVSPINNLDPAAHGALYRDVESVLTTILPIMQRALRIYDDSTILGKRIQVIVKAANYILEPGQTYDGKWHVEGMAHERIVATGLYYYDTTPPSSLAVDKLSFRKRDDEYDFINREMGEYSGQGYMDAEPLLENYNQDDPTSMAKYKRDTEHHEYMLEKRRRLIDTTAQMDSIYYMGDVNTLPGRCVSFINSFQHKVTVEHTRVTDEQIQEEISNVANAHPVPGKPRSVSEGKIRAKRAAETVSMHANNHATIDAGLPVTRKILVFWLIHPEKRIYSTADVFPLQDTLTREEAEMHRLSLMSDRTQSVTAVNGLFTNEKIEVTYNFCEH